MNRKKPKSRRNAMVPNPLEAEMWSTFQRMVDYPETEQSKRIAEILDRMAILRSNAPTRERMNARQKLNGILSEYKWCVKVSPSQQGPTAFFYPADGTRTWEYDAIRMLPYLGERPRIRRCEDCGAWLYAGRNAKQRFCDNNGRCRQHAWDSKPGHKEQKRENTKSARKVHNRIEDARKKDIGYTAPVKRRAKARG